MSELPNRELLLVSEVAAHFAVTDRTVRLWLENNLLEERRTPGGAIRITRVSVLNCRFNQPNGKNSVK